MSAKTNRLRGRLRISEAQRLKLEGVSKRLAEKEEIIEILLRTIRCHWGHAHPGLGIPEHERKIVAELVGKVK